MMAQATKRRSDGVTEGRRTRAIHAPRRLRGFTITELLVAVAVLVGIMLAIGKIFSTTSTVARIGQAGAEVLAETAAIEKNLRSDLERIDPGGVLLIRCVEVPNDINGAALLDPTQPPTALLRADQLLFFTQGVESVQTVRTGSSLMQRGQGASSRVYYGHGFQLAEASVPADLSGLVRAIDPEHDRVLFPWSSSAVGGAIDLRSTRFETTSVSGNDMFDESGGGTAFVIPSDARRWPLVRQNVILVDDDFGPRDGNNKTVYLEGGATGSEGILTARSIFRYDEEIGDWTPQLYDGRVDAAATRIADVRRILEFVDFDWPGQRGYLLDWKFGLLWYPRAERVAPSMHRVDQALTNHVLGTACSSLTIDWTWIDGVGAAQGDQYYFGFDSDGDTGTDFRDRSQPWFGLYDDFRGVYPLGDPPSGTWRAPETVWTENIEGAGEYSIGPGGRVRVYEAAFGFNRNKPLDYADPATYASDEPDFEDYYTPWPTALRITMRLHDPDAELEGGREVQFILALPRSVAPGIN